jgi:PKD repeat protein
MRPQSAVTHPHSSRAHARGAAFAVATACLALLTSCGESIAPLPLSTAANLTALTSGSGVCQAPGADLVGWWGGEGTAADLSGGARHGAFVGAAKFASGKVGQAFLLDGTNYVRINDDPAWRFGSGGFTVELWAQLDPSQDPGAAVFVAHDTTSSSRKWIFWLHTQGHNSVLRGIPALRLHTSAFQSNGTFFGADIAASPFAPAPGQWYHLAITREPVIMGGRVQLYINGNPVATQGDPWGEIADASPASLWIGAAETIQPRFKGLLDEVSIYRRALSASEIRAIATAEASGKCTSYTSGIVAAQPGGAVREDASAEFRAVAGWAPRPDTESQMTYQWTFGDGSVGSGAIVNHVYSDPGQFAITLVVTDADGHRSESTANVVVEGVYAPQPAGLVGWWRGEGSAVDFSGGARHGAFVGAAKYASGKVGQAFLLDGTNYVRINDDPAWRFGSGGFTVELWAQLDPSQDPGAAVFVAHDTTSSSRKWIFWLHTQGHNSVLRGTPALRLHTATFQSNGTFFGADIAASPFSPTPSQWYHLAITREPVITGGRVQLYINGNPVATQGDPWGDMADASPASLWIGAAETIRPTFKGLLDEVSIYRRALSATEIRALATSSLGKSTTVQNHAPTANAGGSYGAAEGTMITFNGSGSDADGDQLTYDWDFGDGGTATGATATHTYINDGHFTTRLRVSDGVSEVFDSTDVIISNAAPTVGLVTDSPITEGKTVINIGQTLVATAFPKDAGSADGPWQYRFVWGDGADVTGSVADFAGIQQRHTYTAAGTYAMRVTVTDAGGAEGVATLSVRVNTPPQAKPRASYVGTEAKPILFAHDSYDADSDALRFVWEFGDGATSTEAQPSHAYSDNGTYAVTLTVHDGVVSHSATSQAIVANEIPSAAVSAPASVLEGSAFQLSAIAIGDVPADASTLHFAFDCGAGYGTSTSYATAGTATSITCPAVPDGPVASTVRVRAFDKDGGVSMESSRSVSVQNVAPSVALAASTTTPSVGQSVSFTGSFTDAGVSDDPWRYQIEWGDGTSEFATLAQQGTVPPGTHSYRGQGSYVVKLTVTDKDGASGVSSVNLTVAAGAPTAGAAITRWTPMPKVVNGQLMGVWGRSSTEVYAVGFSGTVLRYDGVAWRFMQGGSGANLWDIWGPATADGQPTTAFAVGAAGTIMRYDGSRWLNMSSGSGAELTSVWGTSSNNVYAVGGSGTILRYDGSSWRATASGTNSLFYRVWGSSASDVYAVGMETIIHFDGTAWSKVATSTNGIMYRGVWGTSSSNVYAVGSNGTIMHFDGSKWKKEPVPYPVSGAQFIDVWGTSATNVYVTGLQGVILRFDGIRWTQMTSATGENLEDIWGWSGSDAFVVGANGTILRGSQ